MRPQRELSQNKAVFSPTVVSVPNRPNAKIETERRVNTRITQRISVGPSSEVRENEVDEYELSRDKDVDEHMACHEPTKCVVNDYCHYPWPLFVVPKDVAARLQIFVSGIVAFSCPVLSLLMVHSALPRHM